MPDKTSDCPGCTLHEAIERRAFLRAAGMVVASLGLLGGAARDASAMPRLVAALAARRGDRAAQRRYALPAADGVTIDRENEVILARAAGKVYAFALACPHQNTALRWEPADNEFRCPKHKSHYRADGTFIEGRATRDMDRLAIRREGATVVVDLDVLYQQDEQPKQWGEAFVSV